VNLKNARSNNKDTVIQNLYNNHRVFSPPYFAFLKCLLSRARSGQVAKFHMERKTPVLNLE
jgi:hypothetical protein